MLITTGEANRKIEWVEVTEWQSKVIARGLVEAVVEECRDEEHGGKHHVHVRITPTGQEAKDMYIPVANREAGEALIAERLSKAV